jgi:DNA mismatch endonuclease (patch repair protein)
MMETAEARRRVMQAVRSKNTRPEMRVRKAVHAQGYRYRLHKPDLPGKPDLAFPSRTKAIFVHGCFWHGHSCKNGARMPKSNLDYWQPKIARNKERDAEHLRRLADLGWKALIVWECETKDPDRLRRRLIDFLA